MNIGQAYQIVLNIVAAGKAGNYLLALSLAFELIKAFTDAMPQADFGMPLPVHSSGGSLESMLDELENTCKSNIPQGVGAAPTGPLAILLLPLLQNVAKELLKKLLGL